MKNKTLYLLSIFINGFGDGVQQIALIWYIYHVTGHATSIGIMIAIYYLPSIFLTPFLSVFVDYHDSKKIVIITNVIHFLIVFVMSISIFYEFQSEFLFYLLQFCLAICYSIYKPASQSFIKESFHEEQIPFIISKSSSLSELALIIGMSTAGFILMKTSLSLSFFINSLTFLIAAFLFLFITRKNPKVEKHPIKINYFFEMKNGWDFINKTEGMKYLLFLSILNSISIQMTTTILLPFAKQFQGSSVLYSFFENAFAIGGVIAGIVITYFFKKMRSKTILLTMGGMMVSSFLLFLNRSETIAILLIFLLGLFTMSHLIINQTLIQLNTQKEYIGRVVGIRTIIASFIKISSALLTGLLIEKIGVHNVLLSFSICILLCFTTINHIKKIKTS